MGPGNGIIKNAASLAAGAALVGVPLPASAASGVGGFRVAIDTAPGGTATRTFTVLADGAATAIFCIVPSGGTTCTSATTITWTAGQRLSVGMTNNASAANAADGGWSLTFAP